MRSFRREINEFDVISSDFDARLTHWECKASQKLIRSPPLIVKSSLALAKMAHRSSYKSGEPKIEWIGKIFRIVSENHSSVVRRQGEPYEASFVASRRIGWSWKWITGAIRKQLRSAIAFVVRVAQDNRFSDVEGGFALNRIGSDLCRYLRH